MLLHVEKVEELTNATITNVESINAEIIQANETTKTSSQW